MKKIILRVTFIAAFAFVAGYGVYASQHEVEMSDLAMANVEALAGGENNNWGYHIFPCNHSPWNECVYSQSDRPKCSQSSYC